MVGIYKIESPSGRVYIGQSWDVEHRLKHYVGRSNTPHQRKLNHSLRKYGPLNHHFSVLEIFIDWVSLTQEQLDAKESYYIQLYKGKKIDLLNLADGGSRGKHSEETKELLSELARSRRRGPTKPWSEERKKQFSAKLKLDFELGIRQPKLLTPEIRDKIAKGNSKPIMQYDLQGVFIRDWTSTTEAASTLGKPMHNIYRNLKGKSTHAYGYIWKHKNK